MKKEYVNINDVPWYRRSLNANLMAGVGFFLFPPLLWCVCTLCLTGDIYYKESEAGKLKTWGRMNKVYSAIMLVAQASIIIMQLFSSQP